MVTCSNTCYRAHKLQLCFHCTLHTNTHVRTHTRTIPIAAGNLLRVGRRRRSQNLFLFLATKSKPESIVLSLADITAYSNYDKLIISIFHEPIPTVDVQARGYRRLYHLLGTIFPSTAWYNVRPPAGAGGG